MVLSKMVSVKFPSDLDLGRHSIRVLTDSNLITASEEKDRYNIKDSTVTPRNIFGIAEKLSAELACPVCLETVYSQKFMVVGRGEYRAKIFYFLKKAVLFRSLSNFETMSAADVFQMADDFVVDQFSQGAELVKTTVVFDGSLVLFGENKIVGEDILQALQLSDNSVLIYV